MSRRPSIPVAVVREILVEAGHRCAVCGVPAPLERAHIVPWRQAHSHKAEDLICLCANCHQRADLERWGEKTMRVYKLRPWVSRQNNVACESEDTAKTLVRFSIDLEIEDFDDYMADMFRHALAGFLRIGPDKVRVVSKKKGSVKVLVELPGAAADELISEFEKNQARVAAALPLFSIESLERAQLRADPTETNVAMVIPTTAPPEYSEGIEVEAQEQTIQLIGLLNDWSSGDASAFESLVPLVYRDLRAMARRLLAHESHAEDELEPTDLVHEVYFRLANKRLMEREWRSPSEFFGFAATLMRRILVDNARGRQTAKRGRGTVEFLSLGEGTQSPELKDFDVAAVDEALSQLAKVDPHLSQIVELRFFAGLSDKEIAQVLGVSTAKVKREWEVARLWLARELGK